MGPASQPWKYLSAITRAIAERLDLSSVLARSLSYAVELVNGQAGLIALRNAQDRFEFVANVGFESRTLAGLEPLLTGIPLTLADGETRWDLQLAYKWALIAGRETLRLQHILGLPLIASKRVLGVIYVFRPPHALAFGTVEQDVLSSFADHVAVAIQNAQLYEETQRRTRELETIIEGSANGLVIADPDGRVRRFNRAFESLTGWPAERAPSLILSQVLRVRDERGELLPLPDFRGRQPIFIADGFLERRDGQRGPFAHVIVAPLYDDAGALFSLVCSVVDLSRRKEAEEVKTGFLTGISHDLKTPLSVIRGYAETLRNPEVKLDAGTLDSSLAAIEEEATYLTNLVDALLDAAQLQAGRLTLKRQPVRLDLLTQKVAQRFQTLDDRHTWAFEFPEEFPEVEADPERIRQAVENVMGNAVKYSPSQTEIHVGGWAEPDRVGIAVRDHGPGIPLEEQERIFERFARGRGDAAKRTRGAGLGLYLCKAIVEQHGGRVWVENMPDGGAAFYMTLPRT